MCSYYIGETIQSLHKSTLIPGGSELLVYTTLSGIVGMMVPFTSREVRIINIKVDRVLNINLYFILLMDQLVSESSRKP